MVIVFDVIVAVLAVFGGYCALKLFSERVLVPHRFVPSVAVTLEGSEDDEYIDTLISEAGAFWQRQRRVMVIVPPDSAKLTERVHRLCPSAEIIEKKAAGDKKPSM